MIYEKSNFKINTVATLFFSKNQENLQLLFKRFKPNKIERGFEVPMYI